MNGYRFIDGEYEIRYEVKRSVFIATAKGELDEDGAESFIKSVRKRYPDATHNCYAYVSDELGNRTRFSDDGEPGGTAGQPILEVLKKQGLVKSAVVVTRYFGGIKLGAGGLVGAYSAAAAEAVRAAKISFKEECRLIRIKADYSDYAALEKLFAKGGCKVSSIEYGDGVSVGVYVKTDCAEAFLKNVCEITSSRAQAADTGEEGYEILSPL